MDKALGACALSQDWTMKTISVDEDDDYASDLTSADASASSNDLENKLRHTLRKLSLPVAHIFHHAEKNVRMN